MNHFSRPVASAALLVCLIGCDDSGTESTDSPIPVRDAATAADAGGRIGTIDLGHIFVTLGLQQQRVARQRELNAEISKFSDDARKQVQSKLEEFGGDAQALKDEQRAEIQKLDAKLTKELRKKSSEAQQIMSETDQFLQRILNQKTKEPIQKVAEKRRLDIVLIRRPDAFAFIRPAVDITGEVLKEIGLASGLPPSGSKAGPPPTGDRSVDKGGGTGGETAPDTSVPPTDGKDG